MKASSFVKFNVRIIAIASLFAAIFFPLDRILAITLFSDDFTGTTIDTTKWNEIDPGGTSVTQNNNLTVYGSYSGGNWGVTSLYSKDTFSRTGLTVSANMSGGTAQLLGYGDYNFRATSTTAAYILDIVSGSAYALAWNNGVMDAGSNLACGSPTSGAKYSIVPSVTGFSVYKDTGSGDTLMCSVVVSTTITNKSVFLQSQDSATFDNILVSNLSDPTIPSAVENLSATGGNNQATLTWSSPSSGGSPIIDYSVEYKLTSEPSVWTNFADGVSSSTGATVTSLTNNLSYDFRVSAVNIVGTSTASNIATTTPIPPTVPGAPTIGTAAAGNTQATISFSAPVSNGGSAITGYTVTSSPGGLTGTGTSSPITVTGLTNGVAYTFTVIATNSVGNSLASASSSSATPSTGVPSNISNLVMWYDASDAATITLNASSVTQINDKSINGRNATASGSLSPTRVANVQNGKSIMRFNGSNYLSIATTTTYRTVFVVAKFNGSIFNDYNGLIGDITGSSPGSGHILNGKISTTKMALATANYAYSFRNGYEIVGSGGHEFSPINEFWIGSFELSASRTNTTSVIGAINGGAGRTWNGDIAEIIVYDSVVSESDRLSLESYLSDKWNIAVSLPSTVPAAISNLSSSQNGPSSIDLSWTAPSNGNSSITNYLIDYRIAGNSDWTSFVHSVSTSTTITVTGLSASTLYEFRARAVNAIGTALTSNVTSIATTQPTVPSSPTIGTAVVGDTQATVNFTGSVSNGGATITSYVVTSSPGAVTAQGTSSPIIVTGLTNNTQYTFTVAAVNSVGTSTPSASSNAVTPHVIPVPEQVTGLSANAVNKQVLLSWIAPYDGGEEDITDYFVEYKLTATTTWTSFSDGTSTSTKAIVTGLTNGSGYDFRVSAVNLGGNGPVSSVATDTPNPITTLAFVITGESNSGGIGLNSSATSHEVDSRPAVQITNLTSGNFLYENLNIGTNNLRDHAGLESYYDTSHGLELGLANSVEANDFPDNSTIYLTKTGQGGSRIANWNVGNTYWTKHLQRTAAAKTQLPSDRQWVVWLSLGINDGIDGTATSTWKTAMIAHLDKIKADLPGAIIVMTEFQSMPANGGYPAYNAVIRELAAEQADVYSVSSTGAATDGGNHWVYSGLKQVAQSMVTVTKNKLGLVYPGLPTGLSATVASDTQVDLSWTVPIANGGASLSDYSIEYKTSDASTWITFSDGVSVGTSTSISGLTPGYGYNFRVSAANSNGTGNPGTVNATTTDSVLPIITSVSATSGAATSSISWNTDEIASSIVDYGFTSNYATSTVEADTQSRVTTHTVNLSSLFPCTTYHFRSKSKDASLNLATSTDSNFTTTGCSGNANIEQKTSRMVSTSTGATIDLVIGTANLSLVIPTGFDQDAVTDAYFQVNQLNAGQATSSLGTPSGLGVLGGHVYGLSAFTNLETALSNFDQSLTLTVTYADNELGNINESSLSIYYWDGDSWEALSGCTVNAAANTISCPTTHFTTFAVFGAATVVTPVVTTTSSWSGCYDCYTKPIVPIGGFKVVINSGATTTTNKIVPLSFNAGSDVKKIIISLSKEFEGSAREEYSPTRTLDLCTLSRNALKKTDCLDGEYTVYVKFYTQYGQESDVVNAKISLISPQQQEKKPEFFVKNLRFGSKDIQVKSLQQFLNKNGFPVASKGIGSRGKETNYFGHSTSAALSKFQEAYKNSSIGMINEKGHFGSVTREYINSLISEKKLTQSSTFLVTLYKGMRSESVRLLQEQLATVPEIYPEGTVNGYFGPRTEKAVQKFQLKYGIITSKTVPGSGIVGPKTRVKLQEVFGK